MLNLLKKITQDNILVLVSIVTGILTLLKCEETTIALTSSLILIIVPTLSQIVKNGIVEWSDMSVMVKEIIEVVERSQAQEGRASAAPHTKKVTEILKRHNYKLTSK